MNGYVYRPRASAYSRAHSTLLRAQKNAGKLLSKDEVERRLKATPGLMFAAGVSLEEVLQTLSTWRLLRFEGERIEVLSW